MATLADSIVSSSSRPLALRMRSDLTVREQMYQGERYFVIKEPIGFNYYRFQEEEYAILCMLDGRSSLDDIKQQFERDYAPQKITYRDLQQFIGMLHRSTLVTSETSGQGTQLRKRRDEKKRKERLGKLTNIFAIRFRGIDPERILNRLLPYTSWFFSPVVLVFVALLGLSAITLILVQFDQFQAKLPGFHQFFGPSNWIWLGLTMAVVKVMHEFGHGLACKRYGGECHEMGLMLLVFTPCLYCNVSDSWMLPNKWKRVMIGAAGMYVELTLAAVATFLWWFSEPGLLNHLCLSVMFICSVSTLLFNGNPLLRFDGYYILMDILEIPNLRQKATDVMNRFLSETCLGIERPENPFAPQQRRWLFALYTVASAIYKWVIVISIILFLNTVLEPYGLKVIGQLVAVLGLSGLVGQPAWKVYKFFSVPGRFHQVKKHRLAVTLGVVAGVVAFIVFVPLPFHVACPVEIQPRDAQLVFATVPGKIKEVAVQPGDQVDQGQVLARLDNLDLRLTLAELEGQQRELQTQYQNMLRDRHQDESALRQLRQARESLAAVEEQLKERREELQRLEILAPVAGTILPAPSRPNPNEEDGRLPSWSGEPLEVRNVGAFLARSDLLCQIGDPQVMEAVLVIDQTDIELVRPGHEVDIKLDSLAEFTYSTEITEIARMDLQHASAALSTQVGGGLTTRMDPSGATRPMSTSYQARAPIEGDHMLRVGYRGRARIYTGWQPIGTRVYRFLAKTFHFDL